MSPVCNRCNPFGFPLEKPIWLKMNGNCLPLSPGRNKINKNRPTLHEELSGVPHIYPPSYMLPLILYAFSSSRITVMWQPMNILPACFLIIIPVLVWSGNLWVQYVHLFFCAAVQRMKRAKKKKYWKSHTAVFVLKFMCWPTTRSLVVKKSLQLTLAPSRPGTSHFKFSFV